MSVSEYEVPPWLLKAAQEANEIIRPYLPLLRDAQKHMDEVRAVMAAVGPLPLPPPELAQVMNSGLREMLSLSRQQRNAFFPVPAAGITGTGGVVLPKMMLAGAGEMTASTATATLAVRDDSPADVGMPLDAKTVFLAILWVFAILLPLKIGLLPPEVQAIIRDYLVTIGTALIIHWRVTDSRKR